MSMPLPVPFEQINADEIIIAKRNIQYLERQLERERALLAELQTPLNTLRGPFKVTS